nr:sialate O-acetylesterase [uncultured Flavobacterium sp.]
MKRFSIVLILLYFIIPQLSIANVKLPKLVGDKMVLQRDVKIPIWGWASAGEKISVDFLGSKYKTITAKDGKWKLELKAIPAGGPYEMTIKGKNVITLKNILIGDVWIASGQSNMEWPLIATVDNFKQEIANANYPNVRLFMVEKAVASQPKNDVESKGWMECNPENIPNFSAVAYFFGRDLYKDINVPIGLISSNWGGTPAESWTDLESVKRFPRYANEAEILAKSSEDIGKTLSDYKENLAKWSEKSGQDRGYQENGKSWADENIDVSTWSSMNLPGNWEQPNILPNYDGVVWFRKEFDLSDSDIAKAITLHLSKIDDEDITYFNGIKIGEMKGHEALRVYVIPKNLLKSGKNVITVKVNDTGGGGGIYGNADDLFAEIGSSAKSLAGDWLYKTAVDTKGMPSYPLAREPQYIPTTLYNAMIAPIIPYAIKGTIWYQGESNADRAFEYGTLFPSMIKGWREKWGYDFPFLFVQLANFMQDKNEPAEYEWAELREAQANTLKLPNTGMAVAIDLGNPDDIHPRNKQDVGKRLELAALRVAYHKDIVFSGPQYKNMEIKEDKIYVTFTNVGSGIKVKDSYGYVKGFAICGKDQKYVWAKGYQEGNTIVLYNESVKNPTAIRYDWSNNPDGNIYNNEGLPLVPFRTDNFKTITENR